MILTITHGRKDDSTPIGILRTIGQSNNSSFVCYKQLFASSGGVVPCVGRVGLGSGGLLFLSVFREENVVKTVFFVKFVKVDITGYATDATRLAMLPKGVSDGRRILVFGHKNMVGPITFASEVLKIYALAGVDHGLSAILFLHELQQLINACHIEVATMIAFYVKDRNEVLLFLGNNRFEIGELLIGSCFATVDMITAHIDIVLAGRVDIGLVAGVLDGGTLGSTNVYKLDLLAFGDLLPIDFSLVLRHINTLCMCCNPRTRHKRNNHQHRQEELFLGRSNTFFLS